VKQHLSNAAYGALDYAAYPALMLAATPVLLRHLGVASYGVWLVANAAISVGSIVSSGFGDAVIQRIAMLRSNGERSAIPTVIANMLAINLSLGGPLALLLWIVVPFVSGRITHYDPALQMSCIWSLRIGSVLILLKSIESVFISALRAFEMYSPAVRVSIATRMTTIMLSVILASRGYGVPALMVATALVLVGGIFAQWRILRGLGLAPLLPAFDRQVSRDLASFGVFSWLQAIAGVFFSQADRLLLGLTLGASAVSYYGVCVQMTQPIHGLTAAALHFLFPYLSRHHAAGNLATMRRSIGYALAVNIAFSALLTAVVATFGRRFLERWMGHVFAAHTSALLPLLAAGFALLSLNVTAHYTLLALGRVRLVAALNLAGGATMLLAIAMLIPRMGQAGAAWSRLLYGSVTCLAYLPIVRQFSHAPGQRFVSATTAAEEA
jgi:O-antigen/teichoic acid export membrane protein